MKSNLGKLVQYKLTSGIADPEFKSMLEDHLGYIRATKLRTIEPTDEENLRAEGDFLSILQDRKIDPDLYWITMRLNDLRSPYEYKGNFTIIYLPEKSVILNLLQRFKTKGGSV